MRKSVELFTHTHRKIQTNSYLSVMLKNYVMPFGTPWWKNISDMHAKNGATQL